MIQSNKYNQYTKYKYNTEDIYLRNSADLYNRKAFNKDGDWKSKYNQSSQLLYIGLLWSHDLSFMMRFFHANHFNKIKI